MQILSPATWKWDFERLPPDVRAAFLGRFFTSGVIRLTETHFALRARDGSGPHLICTLDELILELQKLPIPEPYRRPTPAESDFDPLDLSSLIADLDNL